MKDVFDIYCLVMIMVIFTFCIIGGIYYVIKYIREEESCNNEQQYEERVAQLEQEVIDANCRCEELQMVVEQFKKYLTEHISVEYNGERDEYGNPIEAKEYLDFCERRKKVVDDIFEELKIK